MLLVGGVSSPLRRPERATDEGLEDTAESSKGDLEKTPLPCGRDREVLRVQSKPLLNCMLPKG